MKEIQNISMSNPNQFAALVKENNGKYIFVKVKGGGESAYRNYGYNKHSCVQFEALVQLTGFGPVTVRLDLSDRIPEPFDLTDEKTGVIATRTSTKKELVEILKVAKVKMESIKTLKKMTLKQMFQVTDSTDTESGEGDEDNFEKIIKGTVDKNIVNFDSDIGKVTLRVEREGHQSLKFHIEIDWKAGLDALLAEVSKAISDVGLSTQEGSLG